MEKNKLLEEALLNSFKTLYPSHEKTLLALSGGPDSVFLFHLLLKYKKITPLFDFSVFHLNHSLRGKESDYEADFVKNLCRKNGIRFFYKKIPVDKISAQKKISLEEAGRIVRYSYLNSIRKKNQINSISTAHHLDDQIETFLMRLFQGAGLKALSGMKNRENYLCRPLLSIKKESILEYLQFHTIDFKTDSSNLKPDFLRNKLRFFLIPQIKQLFPEYRNKIMQFQKILLETHLWINQSLFSWKKLKYQIYFSLKKLKNMPEILIKEQLLKGLKNLSKSFYLSTAHIEKIVNSIQTASFQGHKMLLNNRMFSILLCYDKIFIIKNIYDEQIFNPLSLKPAQKILFKNKKIENLSSDSLYFTQTNPGEKITFSKTKKISDFLTEKKHPFHFRKFVYHIKSEKNFSIGLFDPVGGRFWLTPTGIDKIKFEKV
ncbi:MAG TPA: tRNA lysidine(34) synthetase TilS [Spirochaetia bacterium]|nr:MAG: tRNA lysidine(34) synthetase TilS [Spirochaetes bacterium GWB1_36_13]HCL55698.1 tRNA lysidine(34) synthetase TilS [Spirochaetia bacterium]